MPRAGESGKECLGFAASNGRRVTAIIEPDNGASPMSRVALAKKPDKSLNPIQIGSFGADAAMFEANPAPDLLQKAGRGGRLGR